MRRLLFLIIFFTPLLLHAQDLLMNGSFEEENICMEYEKNCAPEGWISTSLYADYYFDDKPHAYSGSHFTGLILARKERPTVRNFLRSRLLCGLRKGARYQLSFYIRSTHQIFDSVGIYFSATDFLYQKDRLQNARPQLFVNKTNKLKYTGEWQKVELVYTANGNENFINIGDFDPRGHDFKYETPDLDRNFYFFIDSVSLLPLNPFEHLCTDAEQVKEEEYAFNVRHEKLDRLMYLYTKNPPAVPPLQKTVVQRVDTLVIPDVLFATNSYALNTEANAVLDSFVHKAKAMTIDSLVVEGHTDNHGSNALNQKLSENRATSVAAYLQQRLKTSFSTRGWASEKPVADNRTAGGRQKNRRVEIYLYVRE
ncbi:MAG: OmpA family protein [Chitinophagaceae bacterium]|nr:MAG: OmpA family protein [Chitinophagaceae bacterium]